MKKLLLLILLIPCVSYAADTATPYGGIEFNNETAGYDGTISAPSAGTYYGFINASAMDLSGFTFNDDNVNGDYLELTGTGGIFLVFGGKSFKLGSPSGENVHCEVFLNAAGVDSAFERVIGAGGDIGSAIYVPDTVTLSTGDKIRVKCKTDGSSKTILVEHFSIFLMRMLTTDSDSANDHVHTSSQITFGHPGTKCYGCPVGQ